MKNKLLTKILIIISIALFFGIALIITLFIISYKNEMSILSQNSLKSAKSSFNTVFEDETQKLSVALDLLMTDRTAKQFFISQQIDSLYNQTRPAFELIKSNYSITHTYYIMPEPVKTCF